MLPAFDAPVKRSRLQPSAAVDNLPVEITQRIVSYLLARAAAGICTVQSLPDPSCWCSVLDKLTGPAHVNRIRENKGSILATAGCGPV
jgi:hypothetical protein